MITNIQLLRSSFRQAAAHGDQFVKDFYEIFFELSPDARALFADDLDEQRFKLLLSLTTIYECLEKAPLLQAYLRDLGRKHVEYQATPEQYKNLGQALILTFRKTLGEDWTPRMEQAWTDAYALIAEIMQSH